ncbi:MAG: aldehyde dehydrogenase family protein [Acidimicrobiia bacterium]
MQAHDKLYIDGAWVASDSDGTIEVINATTEEVLGTIPEGTQSDVDRAVAAAKRAFASWSQSTVDERSKYIQALSENLQSRTDDLAKTISQEVGTPLIMSQIAQASLPAIMAGTYVEILRTFEFQHKIGNSTVVRDPIGVVGCITPWNYPLHQVVAKVAPALAAGCTVVLKPSEVAPLSAFILADVIDSIGLPRGVFNLVTGTGPVVGEALVAHPDVSMISFTGSTRAGKRIAELASQQVKRVTLELGGKSPFIILDDADVDAAVRAGFSSAYLNGGQTCIAWTRMLAPRSKYDEIVAKAKEVAEGYVPGDPLAEGTTLGPMVSAVQRDRVRSYIQKGIDEGATLVTGGTEAPEGLDTGYFVRPTVFADVRNDMTVAQEEIFGPVLSIIPYDDDDDAVAIANDTIYGLSAGVYGGDTERAVKVAHRIHAGQVDVNGQGFNPTAPFGGYKQSGLGREYGEYGLEEYLEVKTLSVNG